MSQNSRNQGFSFYICLIIEGSGSGSIPLTNGSGSGRPETRGSGSEFGSGTLVGEWVTRPVDRHDFAYNRIASSRHVPPWAYEEEKFLYRSYVRVVSI
jgi:hypothetical protein